MHMMGMDTWVFLLLGIGALFACWSFSLVARGFSDWVARRRKRLNQCYSPRAKLYALVLFVLCVTCSIVSLKIGFRLSNTFSLGFSPAFTPAHILSYSVMLFAIMLIIMGIVGDRARGRLRCPRCWYDMQHSPDLCCSECGHTSASSQSFSRTRRPKWFFLLALFFLGSGGFTAYHSNRISEIGYTSLIPNFVLTMGWDEFPDHWILDGSNTSFEGNDLDSRIQSGWLSDGAMRRFAKKLIKPMAADPEKRWEPKRITLLTQLTYTTARTVHHYDRETQTSTYTMDSSWYPRSIDIDQFFLDVAHETLDALIAVEQENADEFDLLVFESMWKYNTLWLIERWIAFREMEAGRLTPDEYETSDALSRLTAPLLTSINDRFDDEDVTDIFLSENDNTVMYLILLAGYSGATDKLLSYYIDAIEQSVEVPRLVPYRFPIMIQLADDTQRDAFYESMLRWAKTGTENQKDFCFQYCVRYVQNRNRQPDSDPQNSLIFNEIARLLITDGTPPYTHVSPNQLTLSCALDPKGTYSLPLVQELILAKNLNALDGLNLNEYEVDITLWLRHIAPAIAQAETQTISRLLVDMPVGRTSEEIDQVRQLLESLSTHEDEEVRLRVQELQEHYGENSP